MARHARTEILYDGCYAHIYSRAIDKQIIFRDEQDFETFKKWLWKTKQQGGYQIHHYCLMNTHFHLIVSIRHLVTFSKNLKEIKQSYAAWFHHKYERNGPVWWGRFGSQLIENEKYLYASGLYVEANPVKAAIVAKPEDWKHSSSRHYFLGQTDRLLDPYDQPSYDLAFELTRGLNVGKSSHIGTPLFLLKQVERNKGQSPLGTGRLNQ